ncbi:RNA-binding protein S4 [Patiriisocius marinistellae]|uniref:RNA-binding protein S4 n=1 Tax=Patiriisocius marinistellae TaxID=2494560 RepID=A0A5J4FWW2_9FLAO|nr:S4 domain-containing protein [Patiriisocius marinistellae]GEQ86710.1 RNA-binding protein S4 [Patiriisocius marinistellae]
MRVDKYLWCVRYFKSRNIATEACKKGAVKVNEASIKPSRDVYPGDNVTVRKNQITYSLEVLDLPKSRLGAKLVDIYRKDTTPASAFEQQDLLKYSKSYYREKGVGRPTKKDRRDITEYIDGEE